MSRVRQQAEFERLTRVLTGARAVDEWVERLQALPGDEGRTLATGLLRAYRHGALGPARWAELTGRPPATAWEVDDAIRRFWDAGAAAGLTKRGSIAAVGTNRGAIRRWAWQPRWCLMAQDEDLLLMEDALVPTLLEIAGIPQLPKRDYILEIVAHHARDSCTAAFMGHAEIAETLRRVAGWAPAARVIGASALACYLERLGRHAMSGPVDRDGAVQLLVDVASCRAPKPEEVAVVAVDGGWEGVLLFSAGNRRLHIDAATGAVRFADSDRGPPGRRRKRR